jgi:transcriptional regulator with XRE-family HTH domain
MKLKYESLRQARTVKNVTQMEIAKLTGVTPSYICKIESGYKNTCNLATAKKLSELLNMSLEEFEYHIANRTGKKKIRKLFDREEL